MKGKVGPTKSTTQKLTSRSVYPFPLLFRRLSTVFFIDSETKEAREDKGDREGTPHTHPIPQVIRRELFLRPQIPRGIRQQPIT